MGLSLQLLTTWKQACLVREPQTTAMAFYNLISEVTYHHFCHMLLATQNNPESVGGNYTRV